MESQAKAEIQLTARPRQRLGSRLSRQLRREGWLPASLYGAVGPYALQVERKAIEQLFRQEGARSRLIRLHVENGAGGEPSGSYPVLLGPQALSDLLRPLVASLDGKAVEKGFSPWAGRLGQQVSGPRVTLVDDGTLPFAPHTAPFDGEGTPCRQTPLLVEGRLETYYLDRRTAARLGLAPTGNGLRSLGSQPAPAPTNLILKGGRRHHREILADLREGVYIESLLGAWAGNPYAGEVQGNVSLGFLVRDGQPVGRIKNCLLAANAFDAFAHRLAELSSDARWVGAELLPYALFEGIPLSAAS